MNSNQMEVFAEARRQALLAEADERRSMRMLAAERDDGLPWYVRPVLAAGQWLSQVAARRDRATANPAQSGTK
jgi:hypothetical protein